METESAQNTLGRMREEMVLNVPHASSKLKGHYARVEKGLLALYWELDVLNDLKEDLREQVRSAGS